MTKNEEAKLKEKIMNDVDFRLKCRQYGGVRWDTFRICENYDTDPITIMLDTPNKDVFVLMNANYDTIGIHRYTKEGEDRSSYSLAYDYRSIYYYTSYFYGVKISDIVALADRIVISSTNNFRSLRMIVNGQEVNDEHGKVCIEYLSYIKFLGIRIESYFKELYKAKMLGITYPSLTEYLSAVINYIDRYIDKCMNEKRRPWPTELLAAIGENTENIDRDSMILYPMIDFLLYERGYQIGSGDNYLKLVPLTEEKCDIENLTVQLGGLTDVPKEVVRERFKKANSTFRFEEINLDEYVNGDTKGI